MLVVADGALLYLPFAALPRPALSDIAGDLLRRRGEDVGRDKALADG